MILHTISHYIGVIASTTVADLVLVIVALRTLPAKLAERFFGYAFDKGIARLKHDQDTALAHVQAQLSHVGDRGSRSNEREYEAIIVSWESFVEAFYNTTASVGGFRRYPDVDSMNEVEVSDYLDTNEFSKTDKQFILNSFEKSKALRRIFRIRELNLAGAAIRAATDTMNRRSVFIPDELAQQIDSALQFLSTAHTEQTFIMASPDRHVGSDNAPTSIALITGDGRRIYNDLRDAVRRRVLFTGSIVSTEENTGI